MSYLTLSNRFGALNNRTEPHILGPSAAQSLSNVVLDSLGIAPQKDVGATVASGTGTARSLYKFSGQYIISTEARQYVEYGGQLIYCVEGQAPKRSADGITFYNLGLKPPQAGLSAAAGAAGVLDGSFTYYVTFLNAVGSESGPSPATVVALALQQGNLTAIPTHLGTGSITSGSPTVTAVTNIAAYQVGQNVIGQIAAGTSAPDASVGIPAGATILSIDTGASTITLSANATATTAGIRITDPQYVSRRIYRTGGGSSTILLVTTLADMTTVAYTDNVAIGALGDPLPSLSYEVPPLLSCMDMSPYGVMAGAVGSTFYFAEEGKPYAWKASSALAFNETIVGISCNFC